MAPRLELQAIFEDMVPNVYFQPPENIRMIFPCIVYSRSRANTKYADNHPYRNVQSYEVTVIDPNPDSVIPKKVAELPMCSYERFFAADNLNHDVYNLFF